MSQSQPNTSNNGTRLPKITPDSSSSQVGIDGLKKHMDNVAAEVINQPKTTPTSTHTAEAVDCRALLEKAQVRPGDQIGKPVSCWAILDGDQQSIVGTMGNISTMTGRAKSKKTFAVTIAVSAAVASEPILQRVVGLMDPSNDVVMLFDTEQSRYHVLRVVDRICSLTGIREPKNLLVYSLRPYSPDERLQVIDYAIHNTPGVGLVVIDGIRDLAVDPITDAEQASRIMTHLLRWTDQFNIHILTVLHQNKGDTNLRGHLGTELVNKSESVISISRAEEKEISIVAPEFCRDKEFSEFGFSVDENGLPFLVENGEYLRGDSAGSGLTKVKVKKSTYDSMTPEQVAAIINRTFSQESQFKYTALLNEIIEASEYVGTSLAKTRAEQFIVRARKQGQIKVTKGFYSLSATP
jgi:hypothetical protein